MGQASKEQSAGVRGEEAKAGKRWEKEAKGGQRWQKEAKGGTREQGAGARSKDKTRLMESQHCRAWHHRDRVRLQGMLATPAHSHDLDQTPGASSK